MTWRAATIVLQPTADGLAGRLCAAGDLAIEIRKWRRGENGVVTLEIGIDDPSWQAFLARLHSGSVNA